MAKLSTLEQRRAAVQVSSLDDMVVDYADMPSCALDRELLTDLTHAYIDPISGRYFHNDSEASQFSEMAVYTEAEDQDMLDNLEDFGPDYKAWMRA
jgi:hypothetical protein